ncbi:hypothetical protein [Amycolatopsis minnesotensis]|uniref:hypothetical protein n=1 Tax=Amycolatopsis minnesotensis TaxID=337894 RepID=UPI0031D19A62
MSGNAVGRRAAAVVVLVGVAVGGLAFLWPLSVWTHSALIDGAARVDERFMRVDEAAWFVVGLAAAAGPALLALMIGRWRLTLIAAVPGAIITSWLGWYLVSGLGGADTLFPQGTVEPGLCAWGLLAAGVLILAGAAVEYVSRRREHPPAGS